MNRLEINKFKAFRESFIIEPSSNNLLLYGDNGSGKSSIYEAIKVVFFHEKIEDSLPSSVTPEEYEQYRNDLWSSYNNKLLNENFELKVDSIDLSDFDKSNYQVFMISLPELYINEKLNLIELLNKFYIDLGDVSQLCADVFDLIQSEVNNKLEYFREDVKILIEPEQGYNIKILDKNRGLERASGIRQYFNEGKINLIVLLLLFSAIYIAKDKGKRKLLVLDDFITSLDIANRSFIFRYILNQFSDCQIFVFTHNVTFFNLIKYIINNIEHTNGTIWKYANLYEINKSHKLYIKDDCESVSQIQSDYENVDAHTNDSLEQFGNRIRKTFEVLLYEFSKALVVGGVEESKIILERIRNRKSIYVKSREKNVYNLIEEIEALLTNSIPNELLVSKINNKINSYKELKFENLKSILLDLKLYQKITMHPLSHGINGVATFTQREIEASLDVLRKMEIFLNGFIDSNVTTV